jgi:hypothetical protein
MRTLNLFYDKNNQKIGIHSTNSKKIFAYFLFTIINFYTYLKKSFSKYLFLINFIQIFFFVFLDFEFRKYNSLPNSINFSDQNFFIRRNLIFQILCFKLKSTQNSNLIYFKVIKPLILVLHLYDLFYKLFLS